MEELRNRLEEIARLIDQKEDEIAVLKQDLEAIRLSLEVAEQAPQEEVEPIVEDPTPSPAETEPEITPPDETVAEEPEVLAEAPPPVEEERIIQTIDAMSQELDAKGFPANEQYDEGTTVSDKANAQRLTDLKKGIGLNERFLFANELFNGDVQALTRAVEELNHVEKQDADRLLNEELAGRYKWDDEDSTVISFKSLVARRFL